MASGSILSVGIQAKIVCRYVEERMVVLVGTGRLADTSVRRAGTEKTLEALSIAGRKKIQRLKTADG